ncbi:MAG: peptide deformylase [Cardiobacteriaceae bacterium]|nr:peptide deformylase [Cardiobacteriaceae bacterium]
MPLLDILIHPDRRLRQIAEPISVFDNTLKTITENMFATMYEANGIGLAATQVNIHRRIVVMDVPETREDENAPPPETPVVRTKLIMINPEIIGFSDEKVFWQEGCLSLPGQFADVERPAKIRYAYQDIGGSRCEDEAEGLLGVCIQHEIDHLNGVLFIDHLSQLKRTRLEKKLAKSLLQKEREA